MISTCWRNGEVVGRIYKANAAPVGSPWMWTLVYWQPRRSQADARLCFDLERPLWQPLPRAGDANEAERRSKLAKKDA